MICVTLPTVHHCEQLIIVAHRLRVNGIAPLNRRVLTQFIDSFLRMYNSTDRTGAVSLAQGPQNGRPQPLYTVVDF
jgi:hypothetical protein